MQILHELCKVATKTEGPQTNSTARLRHKTQPCSHQKQTARLRPRTLTCSPNINQLDVALGLLLDSTLHKTRLQAAERQWPGTAAHTLSTVLDIDTPRKGTGSPIRWPQTAVPQFGLATDGQRHRPQHYSQGKLHLHCRIPTTSCHTGSQHSAQQASVHPPYMPQPPPPDNASQVCSKQPSAPPTSNSWC